MIKRRGKTSENIYEKTKPERSALQANNIRAVKDAWYSLLLTMDKSKKSGAAEVFGIQDGVLGTDLHYSLDINIRDFNPKGNLNTELATITLRCRYKDGAGRLQFPTVATLEISGSPDEQGRIGLDIRHTRTEPGHEGQGFGQALMSLINETIPLLMTHFEKQWGNKTVYVLQQDMAAPADKKQAQKFGFSRKGWTRTQAESLGFTEDHDYIKKYLGEDFLPLPPNTLVRVYKHPQL